jgi:phosphoribosylformylglycinamidine cyclo-ligase
LKYSRALWKGQAKNLRGNARASVIAGACPRLTRFFDRSTNARMSGLNYQSSGVDYDRLDAFKRACQREASTTRDLLAQHGMKEADRARGESAYLIETPDAYLAHVEEGLGTKNLVADAMQKLTGKSYYVNIGIDVVATIVNDLITCGAAPISVAMHAAVGSTSWFDDAMRAADLAKGFAQGCKMSSAVWGGGETPALRDIVMPEAIVLAGSAIGTVQPKALRITGDVRDGDAIVMLASSGVQTNGLTLCRALADRLPQGYLTKLDDGRTYGEALLAPSVIYVSFVTACQRAGVPLHYAAHVTGHGWRKLMRLEEPFVYEINSLAPANLPAMGLFRFMQSAGKIEPREMYATFNMGAGFAIFVSQADAQRCVQIAGENGYTAWVAGNVRKEQARRAIEITPLNITFASDSLSVR